jgi:hypothetical protein
MEQVVRMLAYAMLALSAAATVYSTGALTIQAASGLRDLVRGLNIEPKEA